MSLAARVLLIEDDATQRRLASLVVAGGCPELTLTCIESALPMAEMLSGGTWDGVIISDQLSWTDPLALVETLRRVRPGCGVIVVQRPGVDVSAALRECADGLVVRSPHGWTQLPSLLARILSGTRREPTTADLSLPEVVTNHTVAAPVSFVTEFPPSRHTAETLSEVKSDSGEPSPLVPAVPADAVMMASPVNTLVPECDDTEAVEPAPTLVNTAPHREYSATEVAPEPAGLGTVPTTEPLFQDPLASLVPGDLPLADALESLDGIDVAPAPWAALLEPAADARPVLSPVPEIAASSADQQEQLDLLLSTAASAMLESCYESAKAALDQALAIDPDYTMAWELLVELQREAEAWKDLTLSLKRLAELASDDTTRQRIELERAALLADHLDDWKSAVRLWERCLERAPIDEAILSRLTQWYREQNDYDALAQVYNQVALAVENADSTRRRVAGGERSGVRLRLHSSR